MRYHNRNDNFNEQCYHLIINNETATFYSSKAWTIDMLHYETRVEVSVSS
jgi:hypothetical protein